MNYENYVLKMYPRSVELCVPSWDLNVETGQYVCLEEEK